MVLVQGGGTLLAECKNTLWMILEAEENASKSPSPLPTPDKEFEAGGFSDSQGSGNVSPTIADMELISKKHGDSGKEDKCYDRLDSHMESELCSACLPTAESLRGFRPLTKLDFTEAGDSADSDIINMDNQTECDSENKPCDTGDFVEGATGPCSGKGLLEDVDLLQGAEVFPPPMAPIKRCVIKSPTDPRDCKCKIIFKKCKGKA